MVGIVYTTLITLLHLLSPPSTKHRPTPLHIVHYTDALCMAMGNKNTNNYYDVTSEVPQQQYSFDTSQQIRRFIRHSVI